MHITPRSTIASIAALFALTALAACYPSNPHDLGHKLVVHGVVTDSATGSPLAGVKVTLLSIDNFPSQSTDAQGYFQFADVLQEQNLLVQYQLAGYLTVTMPVNPTLIADGGTGDGGVSNFSGFGSNVDGFDASIALAQDLSLTVAGVVYDGPVLVAKASLMLTTANGTPAYQTTSASDGSFSFASVHAGNYSLIALPWDRDNDGLADTQFFTMSIAVTPGSAIDLGHVAVNLADVQKALVASSFVSLSRAYPITGAQLLGGVSGVLQATGGTLSLTFGAEVDPTTTSFQLVQFESGGTRFSPPIALTVAWSHGVTALLTPGAALIPSDASNVGYQLRVTSLRFADGTVAIQASPNAYGMLNFTVQSLPVALANPQPSLYLANQFTDTQVATKAVFDANTAWLLDANGDFVFDTNAAANWSSGNPIQLQWPSVPGAVSYHLFMRNTTSAGDSATGTLDWIEQTTANIEANDPNQTQTIVATNVSPWSLGLTPSAGPWSFGNHIQFAVTAQDALGFTSPIDPNKLLDTGDTFGGLLTGAAFDVGGNFPFATTTELGDTYIKTLRLSFSEPMLTSRVPTVTALGPRAAVKKVLQAGWSNGGSPGAALNSATQAWLSLQLATPGTCTEVTVARAPGDNLVVVRDASYFAPGATSSLAFLSPTGQFLTEIDGIGAVDTTSNQLTLSSPLATGINVAQGSYACALQGTATTAVPSSTGSTLTVANAAGFAVGDSVLYYEPQSATAPIADVLRVAGVDTTANTVLLQTAPSAGHTAASILFVLPPFDSEIALRPSQTLAITRDVPGGAGAQFVFAGPIAGLAVGDKLLIDADGDLKTTVDQAQVTVTALSFAPTGTPAVYAITADVPAAITLLHGRAKVLALGDTFSVTSTQDTSGNGTLDPHRDQLTSDGVLY